MKLIKRKDIFELPIGSLLSEGEPIVVNDIFVLGDVSFKPITGDPLDFVKASISCPLDVETYDSESETCDTDFDASYRDGLFEHDQTYWLWEEKDVIGLVEKLKCALEVFKADR